MSRRLQWSWVVLVVGALYGAEFARQMKPPNVPLNPLLMVLISAYLFWAVYWGFPVFWRWASRFAHHTSHIGHLENGCIWLTITLALTISCGLYFSLFGGGIYQFVKAWRAYRP